jgi:hypothetical protein
VAVMTKPNRAGTIAPLEFPLQMNLSKDKTYVESSNYRDSGRQNA